MAVRRSQNPLKKLDDRSKKFKFVGYVPQGYKLWDTDKRKVIISRDVRFETIIENEKETRRQMKHTQEEAEEDSENEEEEPEEDRREENRETEEEQEDSTDEETVIEISSEINSDYEDTMEQRKDNQEKEDTEQIRRSEREKKASERYEDHLLLLTYQQAITGPNKAKWKQAIQQEMDSLKKNNTWKIVDREEAGNRRSLSSKWIFKEKENGKSKARLVIRGCEQKPGVDFENVFSPVVNSCSLRILFALAAKRNYHVITSDIKTAFLYGELDENIYMQPPQGYDYGKKFVN